MWIDNDSRGIQPVSAVLRGSVESISNDVNKCNKPDSNYTWEAGHQINFSQVAEKWIKAEFNPRPPHLLRLLNSTALNSMMH